LLVTFLVIDNVPIVIDNLPKFLVIDNVPSN